MTKFTQQDISEKKGRNIFKNALAPNYFEVQDWGEYAKDKYPDIDGQIRLMDGTKYYLNLYLHYQLKSKENVKNNKYFCPRNILDYLLDTNVPTLLLVVDISREKTFWYFLDPKAQKELNLQKDKKGRTIDLTNFEISGCPSQLSQLWQHFAKEDDYREKRNALDSIALDLHQNLEKCAGLLYLLKKVHKSKLPNIFQNILSIDPQEAALIIDRLHKQDVITSTTNLYLLENDKLGQESLLKLLDELDLELLDKLFPETLEKANILEQLAKVDHPQIQKFLTNLSSKLGRSIKNCKTNEEIEGFLELLHKFSFRVPEETLSIFRSLIYKKNILPPEKLPDIGMGQLEGQTHEALLKKIAENISRVCFFNIKRSLQMIHKLYGHQEEGIRKKAEEALGKLCGYKYEILTRVGYKPQLVILEELSTWSNLKFKKNAKFILASLKMFLQLGFINHSMRDYQSVSYEFCVVPVSNNLKKVRGDSIQLLKKLFSLSGNTDDRREVLKVLLESSQPPSHGRYAEGIERLIRHDVKALIKYYIDIIPDCDPSTIQVIEDQAIWFSKRFGKERLPQLDELKGKLSNAPGYELFRTLVGHEWRKAENLPWQEAQEKRIKMVKELVADISDDNLKGWEGKLNSVKAEYNSERAGEFQYFNIFLYEFGHSKPELALNLIYGKEAEWEPFLIHIIGGIWEGGNKELALRKLNEWSSQEKFLTTCTRIHSYVREIDKKLLKDTYKQAKSSENIQALNNIIETIFQLHKGHDDYTKLAIESIKILTTMQDTSWVNFAGPDSSSFYNQLTEKEINIILKSLLLVPSVDYRIEEILKPILERFPRKVIDFFRKRISIQTKRLRDFNYDAIPFDFYFLKEVFEKHSEIIIPQVLLWLNKRDWIYRWEASHFFKAAFPNFNKYLEKELIKLVNSGQEYKGNIVLSAIKAYQGESFIQSICQTIIKKFPKNGRIRKQIFQILSETGVVRGEYGHVEEYQRKKQEIQSWKSNRNKAIRDFADEYEKILDEDIDYHKNRADEYIAVRKRDFN